MNRRYLVIAGAALAIAAGGVGVAVAGGGGDDASEQVSGPAADKARAAALAEHPGTANAVERDGDDGGSWEVEITGNDGKTVDVELDENYDVIGVERDDDDDESGSENE